MRISPLMSRKILANGSSKNNNDIQFVKNNVQNRQKAHQYTGNACADLAYASMIDENIANDLKSMDLIV